ncbi:hypothetical protein SAMD00019534_009610, partial [Acytostelium subglobosum LB1]|uniref:hypothetical protein n=1 Tax=Acytostelium subglobosum LB1 TaxID=1410327 RepID=UPI000644FCE3
MIPFILPELPPNTAPTADQQRALHDIVQVVRTILNMSQDDITALGVGGQNYLTVNSWANLNQPNPNGPSLLSRDIYNRFVRFVNSAPATIQVIRTNLVNTNHHLAAANAEINLANARAAEADARSTAADARATAANTRANAEATRANVEAARANSEAAKVIVEAARAEKAEVSLAIVRITLMQIDENAKESN